MNQAYNLYENKGVYIIKDTKFNEVIFSLRIIFDLKDEYATLANIMANLYSDRLISHPTKKAMNQLEDELYGVRTHSKTYSVGKYQILEISCTGINNRFVDENLHQAYYDLLMSILEQPLINDKTFVEAKKIAKQTLLRLEEQPASFAVFEAFKHAGKDQIFGVNVYGDEAILERTILDDIKKFHQRCVNEFAKELYVVGDIEPSDVDFNKTFMGTTVTSVHKTQITPKTIVDTYEGNQSEIIQVYETDIDPNHELYYPYLVMLAVLGQSPTSLMFENIREKQSLCYSIYASQLIFDGLFYIGTSVNKDNETLVIELIQEQFERIKAKEFDLESTKQYLVNRVSGTTESARSLLEFKSRNRRLNLFDTPEDLIQNFKKVTEDEVVAVLSYIGLPLTYIYRGEENEEN